LEQEANDLERELVKRSAVFAEQKTLVRVTWRDVQKALGPDEAAVEFVRFRFHDGKKWTDTNYYAALIVTPQSTTAPTFVLLGDAKQIEGVPLVEYQQRVRLRGTGTCTALTEGSFYKALWLPLEAPLAGTKRVYLSPDGILNQISPGVVPASDGHLLMEKYHLRLVSSTKDLLREKSKGGTNSAVLIGNPQFDLDEAQQRAQLRALEKPEESKTLLATAAPVEGVASGLRSRDKEQETLPPLPGTKVELESVRSLLEKQRWQVEMYTGGSALKEVIERVEHPRVLHVATHGFFLSNQERLRGRASSDLPPGMEDPMVRSGLFFAGANPALAGKPSPGDLEDGVLTAYEGTGLNLQGTELVVLSACDTGLGQVKNGEGVFGLRRAFEEAGAQAVLMSLWSVPDQETQELMTLFYTKWLSGKDKYEALREAQLDERKVVKKRYGQDLPFYWGAFVLAGR
jgi:CHAT domain-containing protein